LNGMRGKVRGAGEKGYEVQGAGEKGHEVQGLGLGGVFSPQFIVAVGLLALTLGLSYGVEFREKILPARDFGEFPMKIGGWDGKRQAMEQDIIDRLDLSDYVMADYRNDRNQSVNLYVAYYESQRKGESIHTPDTCLPGSGWVFSQSGLVELPMKTGRGDPMKVKRAFIQKGDARQLAYYWFPMRGRVLTSAWEMKFYTFWDALTRQRTDGALVRLITPVYGGESVGDADARLKGFAGLVVPVLGEFVPG
jgi:EpsI family protein